MHLTLFIGTFLQNTKQPFIVTSGIAFITVIKKDLSSHTDNFTAVWYFSIVISIYVNVKAVFQFI